MDAITSDNLEMYFDLLRNIYDDFEFDKFPESIYNMDETGVPLSPRPPKIIAKKGQKKVRYRTTGDKAQITVIGCGSATGQAIPPFIIFAAKQISPLWTIDEVNGSRFAVSEKAGLIKSSFISGSMNTFFLMLCQGVHSFSLMDIALILSPKVCNSLRIMILFSFASLHILPMSANLWIVVFSVP